MRSISGASSIASTANWPKPNGSMPRRASGGADPQPGLALLRLAQGRGDVAAAATRRVLSAVQGPFERARFLPAHVEVMLATSEVGEARRGADELGAIAADSGVEVLTALAAQANGAVALAEGNPAGAVEPLRHAQQVWQRAGAPYHAARVRVVLGQVFLALGDEDGA